MNFSSTESITERNRVIDAHRRLILEIRELEPEISKLAAVSDPRWRELEQKRSALLRGIEPLIQEYWNWVPAVRLSRCPFCQKDLARLFDPVDLAGFWWMDRTQRLRPEPECCEHFCLLLGAVNLNGLAPRGGLFECRPGPDMPYVIARILEMPTMTAVVSCIPMQCGYNAYPAVYFSQTPPNKGSLTQSWSRKEYRFTLEDGRSAWDITHEADDYDLTPWITRGKLRWFHEGALSPADASAQACLSGRQAHPFQNVAGKARSQILIDNQLRYVYSQ